LTSYSPSGYSRPTLSPRPVSCSFSGGYRSSREKQAFPRRARPLHHLVACVRALVEPLGPRRLPGPPGRRIGNDLLDLRCDPLRDLRTGGRGKGDELHLDNDRSCRDRSPGPRWNCHGFPGMGIHLPDQRPDRSGQHHPVPLFFTTGGWSCKGFFDGLAGGRSARRVPGLPGPLP